MGYKKVVSRKHKQNYRKEGCDTYHCKLLTKFKKKKMYKCYSEVI